MEDIIDMIIELYDNQKKYVYYVDTVKHYDLEMISLSNRLHIRESEIEFECMVIRDLIAKYMNLHDNRFSTGVIMMINAEVRKIGRYFDIYINDIKSKLYDI